MTFVVPAGRLLGFNKLILVSRRKASLEPVLSTVEECRLCESVRTLRLRSGQAVGVLTPLYASVISENFKSRYEGFNRK